MDDLALVVACGGVAVMVAVMVVATMFLCFVSSTSLFVSMSASFIPPFGDNNLLMVVNTDAILVLANVSCLAFFPVGSG